MFSGLQNPHFETHFGIDDEGILTLYIRCCLKLYNEWNYKLGRHHKKGSKGSG
jgi:hypothetical protein